MQSGTNADDSVESTPITRRRFLAGAAVTGAALATGAGGAVAMTDDDNINYGSDFAHDPRITGNVTVDVHHGGWNPLTHINNDGAVENLTETYGVAVRDQPDSDTPHNPITLTASEFRSTTENDDGSLTVKQFAEYADFPRGIQYDADGDGSADTDVSVLDKTHWTVDASGSAGTFSLTENGDGSLTMSHTGAAAGDVATATLDLSTVGSTDGTITSGADRKILQLVNDITTLTSGALVEYGIQASDGTEVTPTIDPSGDASTEGVLAAATGSSVVAQARVGELGSLPDIQKVILRFKEADAEVTHHGFNLERESRWEFGDYETTDADGNLITETYEEPSGSFSITSLSTLPSPFDSAGVKNLDYSIQQDASRLLDSDTMVRTSDAPSTYDYDTEVEIVRTFPSWTAYDLSANLADLMDTVALGGSRYGVAEISKDAPDFDTWEDVENHSWTTKTTTYEDSSVGTDINLGSVSAGSTPALRLKVYMNEADVDDLLATQATGAVASSDGGGGIPTFGLGGIAAAFLTGFAALVARFKGAF